MVHQIKPEEPGSRATCLALGIGFQTGSKNISQELNSAITSPIKRPSSTYTINAIQIHIHDSLPILHRTVSSRPHQFPRDPSIIDPDSDSPESRNGLQHRCLDCEIVAHVELDGFDLDVGVGVSDVGGGGEEVFVVYIGECEMDYAVFGEGEGGCSPET